MWQNLFKMIANINWDTVIGFTAIIFTAISLYMQRKHNRLSVKPIAIISVGDYEHEIAVYLQNKGTGPLIIKDLSFTDGQTKEKALIDFFGSEFNDVAWTTFVADIDGWAILPGETKTLIKKNISKDEIFVLNKMRKILSKIEVNLKYQDVYEKDMPLKTRKLDFFAR